ncbi:HD domain-containing protein [Pseudodesulfovibrio cashew]|uniref:HD domain-containing protein n=1 Tax=Pseudodesulfovibrio cashew TaxID=2678688 RepID=A0A6I6JC87_9BACT|nr:HD domain-containing phosphohydrolase [Pseudodesulfovibrio cashew]QGY38660.1 HD domain-containing protein [Pseudodesulfovibrio cashew]
MTESNETTGLRVLMVDDDSNLLNGYQRALRGRCEVHVALGGEVGLAMLEDEGPFSVVVSDIKMPVMSGIEFLGRVRELHPDTVRMVLTGHADLDVAIEAVNNGDIFRFLTKPCDREHLLAAITAADKQHGMIMASRELAAMRRLKEGFEGTLLAFARLVEFRDPYTAGHMDRVARIAELIAERMGMDPDRVEGLRLAGLVHDVGKIAVPAGILNKPGILSDAEFSLIKAHPLVGEEVFRTLETEWPIARIIVEHHERIDGSGYPHGLTADELLEESKILSVADVIDAVMSHRPYRQKLGGQSAIDVLKEGRGTRFDPAVAAVGIAMLSSGEIEEKVLS